LVGEYASPLAVMPPASEYLEAKAALPPAVAVLLIASNNDPVG